MRLWHQSLIPHLPRQQLLGLYRECCALRSAGWGRKHATVDYVFIHDPSYLVAYHYLIMNEMRQRGYNPNQKWYNCCYRGNKLGEDLKFGDSTLLQSLLKSTLSDLNIIYPEHNDAYLQECIKNLRQKGIDINVKTI